MTASDLLLLLIAGPIVFGLFAWLSPRFLRAPVVIAGCALTAVSGLLAIGQRSFTITLAAWGPDLA